MMPEQPVHRRIVNPEALPEIANRFSQAIVHGPLVFLAGMIASDFSTGLDPSVQAPPGLPYSRDTVQAQTEFVLHRQERVAAACGTDLGRAAQLWTFLTDTRQQGSMLHGRQRVLGAGAMPAATTMGVQTLTVAGGAVEIDAILAAPGAERAVITGRGLPPAPESLRMSRAVRVGPYIFVSSLAAADERGGLSAAVRVSEGLPFFSSGVKQQTGHILRTLQAVLLEAGSSLDCIVKAQVTLPDLTQFAAFEEVWQEAFPSDPPARTIIPAQLSIPGCLVEINAIAIVPDGATHKQTIHTDRAPTPSIHQPQAVQAGPFIFLSGVMATDWKNGVATAARKDPEFPNHDSDIRRQLGHVFETSEAILDAAGSSLRQLVRRQGFYPSFEGDLPAARDLTLATFAPDPSPSTHVALGTGLLVPGCRYLFDAVAVPS